MIQFNNYENDSEKLESETIKAMNVLIVGLTGSGKSSIIKSICSPDHNPNIKTKMLVRSITRNLKTYEGNKIKNPKDPKDQYMINLFDTVGLGDSDITVSTILKEVVQCMPKDLSKIHKVVFCFKMDRLRAKISEELNILHSFFTLVGATSENFVVCLTFCDILNNDTIKSFWDELKSSNDLAMIKEVQTVTYTAFPNLEECDANKDLHRYLEEKMRVSGCRIFESVIAKPANPFYPQDNMLHMPAIQFDQLYGLLREYNPRRHWWWNILKQSDHEDIIKQIKKLRLPDSLAGQAMKEEVSTI